MFAVALLARDPLEELGCGGAKQFLQKVQRLWLLVWVLLASLALAEEHVGVAGSVTRLLLSLPRSLLSLALAVLLLLFLLVFFHQNLVQDLLGVLHFVGLLDEHLWDLVVASAFSNVLGLPVDVHMDVLA